MNWGYKILALYLSFVALIVTLMVRSYGHTTQLEYKDYYAREIRFQEQLDAMHNAEAMPVQVGIDISTSSITLAFPAELSKSGITGEVILLRPSDSNLDRTFTLAPDANGGQMIPVTALAKGAYKLQLKFSAAGKPYFIEKTIRL
jgi:hypothetical protein